MKNNITASVEFYFKGEKISSSIELDIDPHMQTSGQLPELYSLLAQAINIGFYSYEYEMMQAETILFSNGKGLIAEHVNEGLLNFDAFKAVWKENQILENLQAIAYQELAIDDLQQYPELKNALLKAYQLGQS